MAKNSSRHLIPKSLVIQEQSEKSLSLTSDDDGAEKQRSNSNSVSQSESSNVFDLQLTLHANSKFKKQLSNVKEEF